ncbi:hypothetical protein POSPLADRAFT_1130092 [Postia placenta MAD-698-R-SB12]|uniref:Uncharacterized protein n=1 Tax=Postia placenta MAD-698-R-SB12 TaxID=670580 RepID=A0A1X6NIN0_9APHY|nr:hypothetical protein POSPLADRAFT_1130092 [Postia placenta MAD-698-R-SB12]OSX68213.1 hypothetical protein POSPLADRAFT_1130092 [Postia placenta MAD-698-R-SB12]
MAALMLAEAACVEGAPPRAPPRPQPRAEKKLFSSGRRARLMSRICSTSVARLSASCHVVKVSSSIFRYTREGMPLRYLSRSSRSPYPERSAGPLNSAENSAALYLCCRCIVEISEASLEGSGEGCFVPEGGCDPLYTHLHQRELGEVRRGPGAGVAIEQAQRNLYLEFNGRGEGASGSPCRGQSWERTLSASGGTEDAAGAEAAVVALRWSNFGRNECSSGLSAESAVKAPEKVRWRGYVRQGLLMWRRALSARRAEQDPRTRTPRLLLHCDSPQAQALVQGLEGDLLVLDRRQFEGGGR